MRIVALDFGEARCGVAVSDPSGTLATPLPAVEAAATRAGLAQLRDVVREAGAERVVVGLPLTLAGVEGSQAARTRAFAARLAQAIEVPVELHDERLTTRQAARAGGRSALDSRAAAHLLESYLDSAARAGVNG